MHNDGMTARKRVMIISYGTRSDLKVADWLPPMAMRSLLHGEPTRRSNN